MTTLGETEAQSGETAPGAATFCDAFQATAARYPDAVALRTADGSTEITWAEYATRVRRIAARLAALGVGRGDTVGILMANRPEFNLAGTAAFHLGATPFSIQCRDGGRGARCAPRRQRAATRRAHHGGRPGRSSRARSICGSGS